MSDISPRRRLAGKALIAAGVLALPLTASITYAESIAAPEAPLPPAPPSVVALAPAAPAAPAAPSAVPAPPAPHAPPLALALQAAAPDDEKHERVVVVRRVSDEHEDHDKDAKHGKHKKVHKKVERHVITSDGRKLTPEERAEIMAELHEGLAEMDKDLEEARHEMKRALIELRDAEGQMTKIKVDCDDKGKGGKWADQDGKQVVMLCTSEIMASAIEGLKQARASIAETSEMDADMRAEVLQALDAKIAEMKKKNR